MGNLPLSLPTKKKKMLNFKMLAFLAVWCMLGGVWYIAYLHGPSSTHQHVVNATLDVFTNLTGLVPKFSYFDPLVDDLSDLRTAMQDGLLHLDFSKQHVDCQRDIQLLLHIGIETVDPMSRS